MYVVSISEHLKNDRKIRTVCFVVVMRISLEEMWSWWVR